MGETIDQTDPDADWVRPLPCVDGTRKTRDIEVILWYIDRGPMLLDPRLPNPDPTALMPKPTVEEVRGAQGAADGATQRKRDLQFVEARPPPREISHGAVGSAFVERLRLADMQANCPYFGPICAIRSKDDDDAARARRGNALRIPHPEMLEGKKRVPALVVAAKRYQIYNGRLYHKVYSLERYKLQYSKEVLA